MITSESGLGPVREQSEAMTSMELMATPVEHSEFWFVREQPEMMSGEQSGLWLVREKCEVMTSKKHSDTTMSVEQSEREILSCPLVHQSPKSLPVTFKC